MRCRQEQAEAAGSWGTAAGQQRRQAGQGEAAWEQPDLGCWRRLPGCCAAAVPHLCQIYYIVRWVVVGKVNSLHAALLSCSLYHWAWMWVPCQP